MNEPVILGFAGWLSSGEFEPQFAAERWPNVGGSANKVKVDLPATTRLRTVMRR